VKYMASERTTTRKKQKGETIGGRGLFGTLGLREGSGGQGLTKGVPKVKGLQKHAARVVKEKAREKSFVGVRSGHVGEMNRNSGETSEKKNNKGKEERMWFGCGRSKRKIRNPLKKREGPLGGKLIRKWKG